VELAARIARRSSSDRIDQLRIDLLDLVTELREAERIREPARPDRSSAPACRLPRRAAARASVAAVVVLPTPPDPTQIKIRRSTRTSSRRADTFERG